MCQEEIIGRTRETNYGSSGKCVPIGEERPKAFLIKVMKNSNSKMQTDKSKCKNGGVSMMPKG